MCGIDCLGIFGIWDTEEALDAVRVPCIAFSSTPRDNYLCKVRHLWTGAQLLSAETAIPKTPTSLTQPLLFWCTQAAAGYTGIHSFFRHFSIFHSANLAKEIKEWLILLCLVSRLMESVRLMNQLLIILILWAYCLSALTSTFNSIFV